MKKVLQHIFNALIGTIGYRSIFSICVLSILCVVIGLVSCSTDDTDRSKASAEVVPIKMYTMPPSASIATENENYMSQLKALVYVSDGDNYIFSYFGEIENISHVNDGHTNFTINVFSELRPVKIIIIANADDVVNTANLIVGQTETDINSRLNKAFTSAGISTSLPMWAEFSFTEGVSSSAENTLFGARALRAVARVDIDASQVSSIFEMEDIRIYRANSLIQLVPNSFTTNPLKVDVPSIPSSSTPTIITDPITVSQNVSTSQLYLPESVAPNLNDQITGSTCVIVGGKYNGSTTTTYYRLDFNPPGTDYPFGQVLRNNQYTFKVTGIKGPGWDTPSDAANNISSHLITSVLDWTDTFVNVSIDGRNFFFIPATEVMVLGYALDVVTIPIETNIQNPTIYWSDALGTPSDEYNDVSIINDYFTASINTNQITVKSLKSNPRGSGERQQYFTIAADRLRMPIRIRQQESDCYGFSSIDAVGALNRSSNINGTAVTLQVQPVFSGATTTTTTYQWYQNTVNSNTSGTLISGATASTYTPPNNTISTVFYYCVVTSDCDGETMASPVFTFTVLCPRPSPVTLTGNRTPAGSIASGTSVTMNVTPPSLAAGSQLRYRWYQGNVLMVGETGTSLVRTVNSATNFRCEAYNQTCTSDPSSITFAVSITGVIPIAPTVVRNTIEFRAVGQTTWTTFSNTTIAGRVIASQLNCRVGDVYDFRTDILITHNVPERISAEIWSNYPEGGTVQRIEGPVLSVANTRITFDQPGSYTIQSRAFNGNTGSIISTGTLWPIQVSP